MLQDETRDRGVAERQPEAPVVQESLGAALAKRLNTLTAQLVAVSSIALIIFLSNIDGKYYREDYEGLKLIDNLPTDQVSAANPKYKFNDWLAANHPESLQQCNQARQALVDQLGSTGFSRDAILTRMTQNPERYTAVAILFTDEETKQLSSSREEFSVRRAKNVGEQLDRFELLYKPRMLAVIIAVELPKQKPVPVKQPTGSGRDTDFRLSEVVSFHADASLQSLVLVLSHPLPPGARILEDRQEIGCPATFVKVGSLSLANALGVESESSLALYNDRERREKLRTIYGALDLENAKTIASEQAVKAYKQVDLLGLSFSTKRIPIAIAAILSLISIGIFVTLWQAVHRQRKVITGSTEDSVIDLIIDWFPTRCAAFLVLPLLAIWASLPPFRLGAVEIVCLVAATVTILILGTASLNLASKL